jgi:RND family efflux transporter MFP subunit
MKPGICSFPRAKQATLAVALCALAACSASETQVDTPPLRPAYVAQVRNGTAHGLEFVGEVRAAQRAEPAFSVVGRVSQVLVEAGDSVEAGQLLAVLDERPLQAQLDFAAGEVAHAKAQAVESQQRQQRLQAAINANAASATEVGALQLELASAEAALRSALANQAAVAWSMEQALLRSPITGIVGMRALEVGQVVGAGVPALVVDGAGRELVLTVPAQLPVAAGQALELRNGSETQTTQVLRTVARVEAGGVRKIYVAVPATATVGSTWSVQLLEAKLVETAQQQAQLEIPLRALLPTPTTGTGRVLRLAQDGQSVELVTVSIGPVQGEWIAITGGLTAADKVVVAGAAAIAPGSRIKPMPIEF